MTTTNTNTFTFKIVEVGLDCDDLDPDEVSQIEQDFLEGQETPFQITTDLTDWEEVVEHELADFIADACGWCVLWFEAELNAEA